jgi:hypothetical protein
LKDQLQDCIIAILFLRDLYDYVEELYKENAELRKEIDQLKKQ